MPRRTLLRVATTAATAVAAGLAPSRAGAATAAVGRSATPADRELRGVWIASVANADWPSRAGLSAAEQQAELAGLFDHVARLGLNAVFVQVRPTADAFWPSRFEPWSRYLTGVQGRDPGYDPLAFMVDAAHERGLALHAWFNPYRVALHADPQALVPGHPARVHPDWVARHGGRLYYDPGVPAARAFVEDAILDAVERYDIDGVHFDDYFYPYPVRAAPFPDSGTFAAYGAGWTDRDAWRRHNVDLLVREVQARVRAVRPEAAFGISPFGIWRNASTDPRGSATTGLQSYDALSADALGWVRQGWVDYVAPQLYWNIGLAVADYAVLASWWARAVAGTDVQLWIGQAVSRVGAPSGPAAWRDPTELSRHLCLDARLPKINGEILYDSSAVIANRLGAVGAMVADHWRRPALPPVLPRLAGGSSPPPPRATVHAGSSGTVVVELRPGGHGAATTRYALRLRPETPEPERGGGTLVAVLPGRQPATWTGPAAPAGWAYTASSVDRANRESPAVALPAPDR